MSATLETCSPATVAAPAPIGGWRRTLADWFLVSGATIVCQVLGTAVALLSRMVMTPAQNGLWQALKLFLTNGNYANLGISKGAARELTIAMGRGNLESVQHGLDLAFTVNTLTSLLYGFLLVGAGVWIGGLGNGLWTNVWSVGLIAVGLLSLLQRYVTFQVTLMRSKLEFVSTSQLSVLEGLLTLAICIPATWLGGLPGLYLGTLAVMAASIVFLHARGALQLSWAWDLPEIRRLIGIGSPIMLAGLVGTLFRTLDKLMILGYLPDREYQLGCYSLALMVTGQLYGLGNMLSIVIGPRLGEHYGHCRDLRAVAEFTFRSSELQAAAMALPAALAMVAAGPVLGKILPDYRSGLAPMLWLIPGTIALVLSLLPGHYLVAVDRQNWSLAATLIATVLGALGNHLALVAGWGINGVAIATSASYGLYLLLLALPAWKQLPAAGRLRCVAMHLLAVGPSLAMAVALEYLHPSPRGDWAGVAGKVCGVCLVWLGTLAVGWQYGGWALAMRTRETSP